MLYSARESTLIIGDRQFDYITFGHGARPLVMIQGLSTRGIKGAALPLACMYRIFAKDFKVWLFDRRTVVRDGITVREMAADIADAMDTLGLSNADVFGVSQGGMIAQYLAIDRPDLVRKMALAVTLSRNNETIEQVVGNWIEMTKQGDAKALAVDMAEKMYSAAYVKRYRPFMPLLALLQKPKDADRFVSLAKACLSCDTYDDLDKIKCPVLVLGGRQDKIVTGAASEEIAQRLGCDLHMYDDMGHAAYEEAKDFNRVVYAFLKE
ncbi:MAG: alpha/beta hydrolase [Clostridia bacterium]|nr:alpha/beta hydrolase [Clostridia bacterium]